MSTFILKWNPAISSFKMSDSIRLCKSYPFVRLNWSIWDYENAKKGDSFYMLRVGEGNIGIVMSGVFSSDPKRGRDWSGKGRTTYYCDLSIDFIIDSETKPIITSDQLEQAIPDFDWRKGHSGVKLTSQQESKLDELFANYSHAISDYFDELDQRRELVIQKSALESIKGGEFWDKMFLGVYDNEEEYLRYTGAATHDCANIAFSMDYEAAQIMLTVWFSPGRTLNITCKKIYNVKTDIYSGVSFTDEFEFSKPYVDAYVINSNGIEIICGEVEFNGLSEYDKDLIPVTI
jgi:hypothetical protein